ncbi:HAMP domain-containing histidine kinase [Bacteroides sp. OttesenSCG-928-D19]|nr:HAMP domain-containing histidine kinase [Bacteroides sp. OttesenSCG-928-D19]
MRNTGRIKLVLLLIAVLIAFSFLYISSLLVRDLSQEEMSKMEVWAEAMIAMNVADEHTDLKLVLKVLNANNTIPVIVADANGVIQTYRNIEINDKDSIELLNKEFNRLKEEGKLIRLNSEELLSSGMGNSSAYLDVYYGESTILRRLSLYPYVQLLVVFVFVAVVLFALMNLKKSEQNMVWVGLSKETAHQLGTPISSLIAWLELMKMKYHDDGELLVAMGEDVDRLQIIADRFSKIGSNSELQLVNLSDLLNETILYMSRRTSTKVKVKTNYPDDIVPVKLNASLFSWVIENLFKNAVDAMNGKGEIAFSLSQSASVVCIDVADTGKGILRGNYKKVFSPGFTTKKRGWGLGLSLAKRIVEEYHHGRIYVKTSSLNKGTIFRIELKR